MIAVHAHDWGFGYTKSKSASKQVLIPSMVGPMEHIAYESDVIPANGHGIAVEVDGRWYFVGEQASLQSASTSQTLDVTRTGSVEQKALFYAASSEIAKTTDTRVAVVTGLPIGDFDRQNKTLLKEMVMGTHTVRRQGKRPRHFEVVRTYIMPQGVGALFALVLDKRGKVVDNDLAQGNVVIVDIGTHTVNFIRMDRLRYVEKDSDSVTSGMGEMLQKLAKDLRRDYGLDWTLQLDKVDVAVRARSVTVFNEVQDISDLVDGHLQSLADTLISKARVLWGSGAELNAVVLAGGGSYAMTPYFEKAYPHVRTFNGDAQFANVLGYYRAGLRKFGG